MKSLKSISFAALLIPTFLVGEDLNHVEVGTRPASTEVLAQIEAEKTQIAEGETQETAGFIFDRYPAVYFSNSHHWLASVAILDNDKYSLEIEDGSNWKVNGYDGRKAINWRVNDPLAITQNNRWLSSYNYRIINKTTNTSVEANLYLGPVKEGQYTRYIIGIDRDRKEILLSDNTHWEVSYLDLSALTEWAQAFKNGANDPVIIGSNSGWDSSCEAILINVSTNSHVRAKQY